MRRTSVLIDVEDTLYSEVVEPMKRNKSFTKLIVSLLNGYRSDMYIRSYIDNTLEEVHKAVVGSFEESVEGMESALANMGLLTDELQYQSQYGYNKFKSKVDMQVDDPKVDVTKEYSESTTEVDDLKKRVSELERTVSEGFDKILSAINSSSTVVEEPTRAEPARVTIPDEEHPHVAITQDNPIIVESVKETIPEEPTINESQANSFLMSLVSDCASY